MKLRNLAMVLLPTLALGCSSVKTNLTTCGDYKLFDHSTIEHRIDMYDYNCDGHVNVFAIKSERDNFPMMYWIDENENHKMDNGEILLDKARDGYNGNETPYSVDKFNKWNFPFELKLPLKK